MGEGFGARTQYIVGSARVSPKPEAASSEKGGAMLTQNVKG